jgi:hypothetical protein
MNTTLSPSPSLIARHSPVAEAGTAFDGFQASHAKAASGKPIADPWKSNHWMRDELRRRWPI